MASKKMELNTTMREAALLLGQGKSVAEVAEKLGKPEQTIYTWRRRDDFIALVDAECSKYLQALRAKAVGYLGRQLEAPPLDSKLGWIGQGAAREIINNAAKLNADDALHVAVSFTGGMPRPKMPEGDSSDE